MEAISTHYDNIFQYYAEEFFGDIQLDWKWFKAQAVQESKLNPLAVSPAGAVGIMQLMPDTSAEMAIHLNICDSPHDPTFSIMAGIAYDRRMWNIWKKESGIERIRFMLAAYNAGAGNIIKAQRLATIKNKWASVSAQLHKITGWDDAPETITYVRKIEKIYGSI